MRYLMAALILSLIPGAAMAEVFDRAAEASGASDDDAALEEWQSLAQEGDPAAQNNLGWMHDAGQGVAQDHAEAVRWYRKSAEQGFAKAQANLGKMYARGLGVEEDNRLAYLWLDVAARDLESAYEPRDIVAARITVDELFEARDQAWDCVRASDYESCEW